MKVKTTHTRKGSVITNLATKEKIHYGFINEAKRASAKIQRDNGGIGGGAVRARK